MKVCVFNNTIMPAILVISGNIYQLRWLKHVNGHQIPLYPNWNFEFLPPAYVVRREGTVFTGVCLLTFTVGGVPGPGWGGVLVSDLGGCQVQVQGVLVSDLGGSQVQVQVGEGIRSQIWGGYPVSVKEKIFDTRFGLIHVQTGKKIFWRGTPPPVKGKFFDTRFGLIHVQTGKKNFCQGTPPPSKEKNFWH